ncbi:MAG: hypothetical protein AAGC55_34070 [Myxococcota bacterium]
MALTGCTEVRSGQLATPVEGEAARALSAQLVTVVMQPERSDHLLIAADAEPILTLLIPPGTPMVLPDALPSEGMGRTAGSTNSLGDCMITGQQSATYADCDVAGHIIDGTWSEHLSNAQSSIHAEMSDVLVAGSDGYWSVALDASLQRRTEPASGAESLRTDLAIAGDLDVGVTWSAEGRDYFLDAAVRVDGLTIVDDCAVAGTVTLTGKLGDAPVGPTTIWFGPSCGEVQISR